MMYTIRVSDGGDKVIAKWKKSNPNLFKKYKKIYKELLGRAHNPKVVGSNPAPATTKHLEVIQDAFLLSNFLYPAVSDKKKSSRRSARRELLLLCGLPGHFSTAPRFALVTMRA